MTEAFINSAIAVAIGELGDKTQLLALLLAAQYRRRVPVIAGIFVATCILMIVTAALGSALGQMLPRAALRWIVGIAFLAIAAWTLIESDNEEDHSSSKTGVRSAFMASLLGFALAELGDKSQLATLTLAAQYQSFAAVAAGSIVGEMVAIVPAVLLGHGTSAFLPMRAVKIGAAVLFAGFGIAVLLGFEFG